MTALSNSFHHIGIVVQDIQASEAWYVNMLGFKRQYDYGWPGVQVVFITRGNVKLELFQNAQSTPMDPQRQSAETNLRIGGINHFALQVDDIDDAIAKLQAKGVDIVSSPREVPNGSGDRFAFIHDNEKMLVELFQSA